MSDRRTERLMGSLESLFRWGNKMHAQEEEKGSQAQTENEVSSLGLSEYETDKMITLI